MGALWCGVCFVPPTICQFFPSIFEGGMSFSRLTMLNILSFNIVFYFQQFAKKHSFPYVLVQGVRKLLKRWESCSLKSHSTIHSRCLWGLPHRVQQRLVSPPFPFACTDSAPGQKWKAGWKYGRCSQISLHPPFQLVEKPAYDPMHAPKEITKKLCCHYIYLFLFI